MTKRFPVKAHITGNVWKITVQVGSVVSEGDTVVIMESMKMERPVESEVSGTIVEIVAKEGSSAKEGDILLYIQE